MSPPNQNSGAAPVYSIPYILYIYVVTCAPPKSLYVADPMRAGIKNYAACVLQHRHKQNGFEGLWNVGKTTMFIQKGYLT